MGIKCNKPNYAFPTLNLMPVLLVTLSVVMLRPKNRVLAKLFDILVLFPFSIWLRSAVGELMT